MVCQKMCNIENCYQCYNSHSNLCEKCDENYYLSEDSSSCIDENS